MMVIATGGVDSDDDNTSPCAPRNVRRTAALKAARHAAARNTKGTPAPPDGQSIRLHVGKTAAIAIPIGLRAHCEQSSLVLQGSIRKQPLVSQSLSAQEKTKAKQHTKDVNARKQLTMFGEPLFNARKEQTRMKEVAVEHARSEKERAAQRVVAINTLAILTRERKAMQTPTADKFEDRDLDMIDAYVASGSPFAGDSNFKSKDIVKEAGARWYGRDHGHDPPFWGASDITTLEELLTLEDHPWCPRVQYILEGKGVAYERWAIAVILERIRHLRTSAARDGEAARSEQNKEFAARSFARRKRLAAVIYQPDDDMEKVARLSRQFELTGPMLIKLAGMEGFAGPRSGISDIDRIERGIRLRRFNKQELQELATGHRSQWGMGHQELR
jgi:hypothetical protein